MRSWNESQLLVDRRSKFQGRCCPIASPEDIPTILQKLVQTHKNIARASHPHMYAWRTADVHAEEVQAAPNKKRKKVSSGTILTTKLTDVNQGYDDCGEASAGSLLLSLLDRNNLANVLVIVTRWYGGAPLGSARFRHITAVAAESLRKGDFISNK